MYQNKMRKRGDINSVDVNKRITNLFSGTYPNRYTNNSLNYYENLKKELEARKTRKGRILFRKQLLEHQDKINYTNELNRVRNELLAYVTRFPILTNENLYNRALKLKELGAKIADEKEFNNDMDYIKKEIEKQKNPSSTTSTKP